MWAIDTDSWEKEAYNTCTSNICTSTVDTKIEDTLKILMGKIEDYIEKQTKANTEKKVEEKKTMNEKKVKSIFANMPKIKNIDFQPPLTIVIWEDGTKTFVRCADEEGFDPEKGAAMAIAKKALGNKFNFIETINYFVDRWYNKDAGQKYRDSTTMVLNKNETDIINAIRSYNKGRNEIAEFILGLFESEE